MAHGQHLQDRRALGLTTDVWTQNQNLPHGGGSGDQWADTPVQTDTRAVTVTRGGVVADTFASPSKNTGMQSARCTMCEILEDK